MVLWFVDGEAQKSELMIRMGNEIQTPELSDDLRTMLKDTRSQIESVDWSTEENFSQAKRKWLTMRNAVTKLVRSNPTLRFAEKYYLDTVKIWSPYWNEFYVKRLT